MKAYWLIPFGVLALFGYALYEITLASPCKVDVRREIDSPDRSKRAIIYGMECGATVDFNTQIAIAAAGRDFKPQKDSSLFSMAGRHDLAVSWEQDNVLIVVLPAGNDRVYRHQKSDGLISIQYR